MSRDTPLNPPFARWGKDAIGHAGRNEIARNSTLLSERLFITTLPRANRLGRRTSADQFRDHLPVGADLDRLAEVVGKRRLGIDAELVIESHRQVLGTNRPVRGTFPPGIGCADNLSAREPSARDQDTHDVAPVVAARNRVRSGHALLVHPGRTAEFAHDDHDGRVEQAAALQVFDQAADRGIEDGQDACMLLSRLEWKSQPPKVSVTYRTPASTSRRAKSALCPH